MKIYSFLKEFFIKNKKNIVYFLFFIALFTFLNDFAFAADTPAIKTPENDKDTTIKILNECLKAIAVVLTLGTNIVGWFLNPEWTSGKIIGIDGTLKNLWIMVSNIVYFIFAGIFIWIAFMNIVGKDGDTYELKKAIPRFIVGVLIVPFSWFFVQFVISLSSILTAAVLSLPMNDQIYQMATKDAAGKDKADNIQVPFCKNGYQIYTGTDKNKDFQNKQTEAKSQSGSTSGKGYVIQCMGESKQTLKEMLKGNGIYSVMYFYTFAVMKFDDYGKLFSGDVIKGIQDITALIFKTGFSIIFIVVYGILIVALGMALFVRGIRFWFFAMFSPVFGLLHFFKKDGGGGDGAVKHFNIKNLIGLALVPVYVSAALAFGIIFILTADKGIKESKLVEEGPNGKGGCINMIPTKDGQPKDTSRKICWDGTYLGENKNDKTMSGSFKGFVGNFGTFLLQLFGIIFLWMGVMAALKQSDITAEVTSPIADFGKQIGDLIKKAPTYAPILPGGLSATGLQQVGSRANQHFSNKSMETGSEFLKKHDLFQNDNVNGSTKMSQLSNKINSPGNHLGEDEISELKSAIKEFKNLSSLVSDTKAQSTIKDFGAKFGIDEIKDLKLNTSDGMVEALKLINNKAVAKGWKENLYGSNISGKGIDELNKLFEKKKENETPTTTPLNGTQNIVINTSNPGVTQNVSLNFKDGSIDGNYEFDKVFAGANGQYTEDEFEKLLRAKGINNNDVKKVIDKLKNIKNFFKTK